MTDFRRLEYLFRLLDGRLLFVSLRSSSQQLPTLVATLHCRKLLRCTLLLEHNQYSKGYFQTIS